MSNKKLHIITATLEAIFVLPSLLYFVVNGYWWLFDGNQPIQDKMITAFIVTFFGIFAGVMIHSTISDREEPTNA